MEGKLRRFAYDHLNEDLQSISKPFYDLAKGTMEKIGNDPLVDDFLTKLWEAKNLAVLMVARPH